MRQNSSVGGTSGRAAGIRLMHSQSRSGLEADTEKADDARGSATPWGPGSRWLCHELAPRREQGGRQAEVKFAHDNAREFLAEKWKLFAPRGRDRRSILRRDSRLPCARKLTALWEKWRAGGGGVSYGIKEWKS